MWWKRGLFLLHKLNKLLTTAILGHADGDAYRFSKFSAESYYEFNISDGRFGDTRFASVSKFIILSVSYAGSGQFETVSRHLLNPHFTTKSNGTGLWLYICHALNTDHGGIFVPKLI
jgi:hypothetical protein